MFLIHNDFWSYLRLYPSDLIYDVSLSNILRQTKIRYLPLSLILNFIRTCKSFTVCRFFYLLPTMSGHMIPKDEEMNYKWNTN